MSDRDFDKHFEEVWVEIASEGANWLDTAEVKKALDLAGYKLPNYQVRELLVDLKNKEKLDEQNGVSKQLFKEICKEQQLKDRTNNWKTTNTITDEEAITMKSEHGYSFHTVLKEEQRAFSQWINTNLSVLHELSHLLPLKDDGDDLYQKIGDGILLCKLINFSVPDTIDSRAINVGKNMSLFKKHENLTLAITSAQSIGCHVINMDSHVLSDGREHIILGLLWQIITRFLFDGITIQNVPGLVTLLQDGENVEDLLKLTPEQILMRWVNFHMEKAGCDRRVTNFSQDIHDSIVYGHLLPQIAPKEHNINKLALQQENLTQRAEGILEQADKMGCREFVTAKDVVNGVEKLNLAFVANLFNKYPGLDEPDMGDIQEIQETREEKMYRNWMNSLGVQPHVNYLYTDLTDGFIMFQIYDIIQPGIVDWKRVVKKERLSSIHAKRNIQVLMNCNYAVDLGRKLNFVLVGIDGNDIMTGNKTLTLGLVWQLMRKYTLSLLAKLSPDGTPIVETEILTWANQRLEDGGKDVRVKHFGDPVNKTALPVIHLIDSMRSGIIDYSVVKTGAKLVAQDCMSNAKYAITMARRIGAPIYALPEDLTEVKHKMVMTVYASLMVADMS